jgi:lipopolysaccharide export system permease protein
MRPRLVFAYLFAQHLAITAAVLGLLLVVLFLGQFADIARYDGGASGWAPVALAALRTPALLQFVLPHVMLISAALAVYRTGSRFELAVLMQAGVAGWRLLLPFFLCGALVGVLYAAAGNPLAAAAYRAASQLVLPPGAKTDAIARNVVLRDAAGSSYIFAQRVTAGGDRLEDVHLIRVGSDHRIEVWVKARQADWTGQGWSLQDPQPISGERADPAGAVRPAAVVPAVLLGFDKSAVTGRLEERMAVPLHRLPATIAFARTIGAPVEWYQAQLHWLLALPLMLGGVSALSAAVVFRPLYSGKWGQDALAVLGIGFVIYVSTTALEALGAGGKIWVPLAEWLVPVATVLATLALVRRKRF